ncbi:MAG: SDR family oxidoreductase [Acidothermales bacterium]|jgi:short-subunit dehydrogenase|nr:SDR family oxidoreductase [Acidothermales bacterium]
MVTGASRGIGRELAVALAGAGMRVGLLARDRDQLTSVADECAAAGGQGVAFPADVTDPAQVGKAVAAAESQLGPVALLINNAGRIEPAEVPFAEADLAAWWEVIETNLYGPAVMTRAVLPGMLTRGAGRVVNVNSGFAYRPGEAYTAYAVSKGALARFTAMLAHQCRERGVSVFDVSPGLVRTEMTAAMPMWADKGEGDWTPPQRMVDLVLAVAAGRLDALSGRFLHAGKDAVEALIAAAERIRQRDARVLRLVPYGDDDPLS